MHVVQSKHQRRRGAEAEAEAESTPVHQEQRQRQSPGRSAPVVSSLSVVFSRVVVLTVRHARTRPCRLPPGPVVSSRLFIRNFAGSARVNSSPGQHGTTATRGRPRALASPPCCCRSAGTIDRTAHRSPPCTHLLPMQRHAHAGQMSTRQQRRHG